MKLIHTLLLIFLSIISMGQDTLPKTKYPWSDGVLPSTVSVYGEVLKSTFYNNLLYGVIIEKNYTLDSNHQVYGVARFGGWFTSKPMGNVMLGQMGLYKTVNLRNDMKLDLGLYFMNFQGRAWPRPSYDSAHQAVDAGFTSPASIYATFKPFKKAKYDRLSITTDLSYYYNKNKLAILFKINYLIASDEM